MSASMHVLVRIAFAALSIVATIGLVGLIGLYGNFRWTFLPENEAAVSWTQAIGSLLALVIAIGVPWAIHSSEKREEKEKARLMGGSLAAAIYPALMEARVILNRKRKDLEAALQNQDAPISMAFEHDPARFLATLKWEIPDVLADNIMDFHLLGPKPCYEVQQLVAVVGQMNRMIDEGIARIQRGSGNAEQLARALIPHLKAVSTLAGDAKTSVGQVHDAVLHSSGVRAEPNAADKESLS